MDRFLPEEFLKVVDVLKKLPGVGEKTALRYAMAIMDKGFAGELASALEGMMKNISRCPQCNNISTQGELCPICKDENRDHSVVCVVKDIKDLISMENAGVFNGLYHVLGGLISPMKGVMPKDLGIEKLKERCEKHPEIKEVVVALDATVEGDTTALYIQRVLQDLPVVVSRPAVGIPSGTDIGYLDSHTLKKALSDRHQIK